MSTVTEAIEIDKLCQEIMTCISESSLNYSVNLTPYSLYITVRKSFSKKKLPSNCEKYSSKQQVGTLEANSKQAQHDVDTLQCKYEGGLKESEELKHEIKLLKEKAIQSSKEREESRKQTKAYEETIKQCKSEKLELQGCLANSTSECKGLKKALGEKEKAIHDLKKENKSKEDKLKDLKVTIDEQTAAMKKANKQAERKLKKEEKKDFLNNLSSDTGDHLKCEMCDENFASQSVLRFHIKNVHSASVSAQTDDCGMQENSSQTDLPVQNLNFDDLSTSDKCDNTPAEKKVLRNHVDALHASVQTEEALLASHAHDSSKQANNLAGYLCYYCDNMIISEAHLKTHKRECHGRIDKSSMQKLKLSLPHSNVFPSFPNPSVANILSFPPIGFPLNGHPYLPPLECEHKG